MKKFFLFAAVAMLALVGCEKQDQSGIELKDVEGVAHVKGKLIDYFNEPGQETAPVKFEGVRVYVTVEAGQYVSDGQGNIVFEAKTNAEGAFDIEVKVGAKSMPARIRTEDFSVKQGERTLYYKAVDEELPALNAGDVVDATSLIAPQKDAILNGTVGEATLKGVVKLNIGEPAAGKGVENVIVAPKGTQVVARVVYFAGEKQEVEKRFVLAVGNNGVFQGQIPVEENGNDVQVEVPQFFIKNYGVLNAKGSRIEVEAACEKAAFDAGHLNAGELLTVPTFLLDVTPAEIVTKNTKFTVKGKITMSCEVFTYSETDKDNDGNYSKINGTKIGSKAYTTDINGGKFQLQLRNAKEDAQINYDLTVSDNKGNYSQEVAVYDGWNLDDVEIYLVIDEFPVSNYVHYYYPVEYKDDNDKWTTNKNGWCKWSKSQGLEENLSQSQKCVGTYRLEVGGQNPNKFFDVTQDATLKFEMTADSKKALKGVGGEVDKQDGHTLWAGGLKY